jgi:hypothetical protein
MKNNYERQLDNIEKEIVAAIDEVVKSMKNNKLSSGDLTAKIFYKLFQLGDANKYLSAYKGGYNIDKKIGSEWLLDFIWFENRIENNVFNKLILACELEWMYDEKLEYFLEDFLKLTIIISDYRLFIFTTYENTEDMNYFENTIETLINNCNDYNFKYLFVGIDYNNSNIKYKGLLK